MDSNGVRIPLIDSETWRYNDIAYEACCMASVAVCTRANNLFVTVKVLGGLDTSETLAVQKKTFHTYDMMTSIVSCHCPADDLDTKPVRREEERLALKSIHITVKQYALLFVATLMTSLRPPW